MNSRNLARKRHETRAQALAVHAVPPPLDSEEGRDSGARSRADDPNVAYFSFDPDHADAAEDLAGELGSQFVEGATRVEDLSARVEMVEVAAEADVPMILEDELGPEDLTDDLPPLSLATESTRFSLEDSEGDGLPDDDDDVDEDDFEDGLEGDELEED